MKVIKVDILTPDVLKVADAICFTSNGIIQKDGKLIMGGGVAKAFRDRFVGIDQEAGKCVKLFGNICQRVAFHIWRDDYGTPQKVALVAFPTKHNWRDKSNIGLIEKSAAELVTLADIWRWKNVYLPFPGVGLGGLSKNFVINAIDKKLDNRFILCYL